MAIWKRLVIICSTVAVPQYRVSDFSLYAIDIPIQYYIPVFAPDPDPD
jgi:hypothetical protein